MEKVLNPRIRLVKICIICHLSKSAIDFPRYKYITNQGKESIRLDSRCRLCSKAIRKNRWIKNKELELAKHRLYRDANRDQINIQVKRHRVENREQLLISRRASEAKRRARGYNASCKESRIPIQQALEMARFGDKYLDAYTGNLIDNPTIDHIEPLHSGGEHVYENLCVTSRENNISKHRTPLLIWLLRRKQSVTLRCNG